MDHESPIPSYAPKHHTPRPNANGAKRVGKGPLPASHSGTLNQQQSELKSSKSAMPPVFRPSAQNTSHSAISADSHHSRKHSHSANPDASAQIPAAPIFLPQQTAATAENHHQVLSSPSDAAAAEVLRPRNLRRKIKLTLTVFATIILLTVISIAGWGYHLYNYGTDRMHKIAALSGAPDTPGTTYLIAGSDQRHGAEAKEISGKRSDTIMLLHLPESGTPALISLPRDTYVKIPGHGGKKINAAFALGGAPLLVKTVEQLSGLTIDHYVEIGMDGVIALTDAVGGINLCYDHDAADQYSGLIWTAGCHDVDGKTALAFSRMRYQDPQGDIGRAKRQRQVVSKILAKAVSKETFLNPARQKRLVGAGAEILTVDQSDSLWDVGMSAFALKDATSKGGVTGTPPISSLNYHAAGIGGSAVLLDQSLLAAFWEDFRNGTLSPDKYETIHASE